MQADVAQEAIEAAAEQAPSKRARKPSAKQGTWVSPLSCQI